MKEETPILSNEVQSVLHGEMQGIFNINNKYSYKSEISIRYLTSKTVNLILS